jgi:hypothetical protein
MKTFFINAAIYYVLISLFISLLWMLTGIGGFIPIRIIISLGLAYYKPIREKW